MSMDRENIHGMPILLGGSAHPSLNAKISECLGIPLAKCTLGQFSNGETRVEIDGTVRGCDCFVIQPICNTDDGKMSVNDTLMELLVFVSALRGSSAERITAVMPLYGYARQDKKDKSRAAITARLVADLLEAAGVDRIMTVDLHASQIQGFSKKPMDNLYSEELMTQHIQLALKQLKVPEGSGVVVVAPDAGGAKRASRVATKLQNKLGQEIDCAIISKERLRANEVSSMRLVGSVDNRIAIIVDDMADTCGTLCLAAETVKKAGAICVLAYVCHGIFSGPAIERINACSELASVTATNTIPQKANMDNCPKLDVVDIASLLAKAIRATHCDTSISDLFVSPYCSPQKAQFFPTEQLLDHPDESSTVRRGNMFGEGAKESSSSGDSGSAPVLEEFKSFQLRS